MSTPQTIDEGLQASKSILEQVAEGKSPQSDLILAMAQHQIVLEELWERFQVLGKVLAEMALRQGPPA